MVGAAVVKIIIGKTTIIVVETTVVEATIVLEGIYHALISDRGAPSAENAT